MLAVGRSHDLLLLSITVTFTLGDEIIWQFLERSVATFLMEEIPFGSIVCLRREWQVVLTSSVVETKGS